MRSMFSGATSFNADISKWDVSKVTDMGEMFKGAESFNQKLCGAAWVHSMAQKYHMFGLSTGSICWVPQSKEELQYAIQMCLELFSTDCSEGPNGPIGSWDVSGVNDLSGLFDQDIIAASSVFDGDVSNWDVSRVIDMNSMFRGAALFNGDVSKWDVSRVANLGAMFRKASSFNGDISTWDVSRATNLGAMFYEATSFNGDISKWNVSRVSGMLYIFSGARAFNGDISRWDVSRVTKMNRMFHGARSFNRDISKWDVSRVTEMNRMYRDALFFNTDISKWDVSLVTDMRWMFKNANTFNKKLCGAAWARSTALQYGMFEGSSGSISTSKDCADPVIATGETIITISSLTTKLTADASTTTTPTTTTSTTTTGATSTITTSTATTACPRCVSEESGRFSCCARGGGWFNNCGNPGDPNVDHTWNEGIQACRGECTASGEKLSDITSFRVMHVLLMSKHHK